MIKRRLKGPITADVQRAFGVKSFIPKGRTQAVIYAVVDGQEKAIS